MSSREDLVGYVPDAQKLTELLAEAKRESNRIASDGELQKLAAEMDTPPPPSQRAAEPSERAEHVPPTAVPEGKVPRVTMTKVKVAKPPVSEQERQARMMRTAPALRRPDPMLERPVIGHIDAGLRSEQVSPSPHAPSTWLERHRVLLVGGSAVFAALITALALWGRGGDAAGTARAGIERMRARASEAAESAQGLASARVVATAAESATAVATAPSDPIPVEAPPSATPPGESHPAPKSAPPRLVTTAHPTSPPTAEVVATPPTPAPATTASAKFQPKFGAYP